jgi:HTH-type transcriptional regulator/antitoxin HigA
MNTQPFRGGIPEVEQAWSGLQHQVFLRPIRSEDDYSRMVALIDSLVDIVGDNEEHPLFDLYDLALELIGNWEREHVQLPNVAPREVLRFLLEEHNMKQSDLSDIASASLISDILAGRREISKRLSKALAERFHVDASAFF